MRFNWKLIAADQLGGAACLVSLFLSRVCLVIDVDDRPIESNDPLLSLSLSPLLAAAATAAVVNCCRCRYRWFLLNKSTSHLFIESGFFYCYLFMYLHFL